MERAQHAVLPDNRDPKRDYIPYDKRKLSYAGSFPDPRKAFLIRGIEWMTGKITLLRKVRQFERGDVKEGAAFFPQALEAMGIDLVVPPERVEIIPKTGPLIVVANHPHGLVDGMVMADLIGRRRDDFVILTRSLLSGVKEIRQFMLPVPFPHEQDALNESLKMRRKAMEHLKGGGVVILFPAGAVASSKTLFGPAVEKEWNPFTAKMIARSGATVLPIYFPGQNSRAYLVADHISPVLRQGLLLHEVVHALNKPQHPVVGDPLLPEDLKKWASNPRGFMEWLRAHTLSLGGDPGAKKR